MSTGWIRGRFVGTYSGELTAVHGDGARRFSLELQSGTVHDAQWVDAPADADADDDDDDALGDGGGGDDDGAAAGQHRKPRLAHVRFAPPGEGERVGTLYDLRVEVTRLRRAHETGTRSFGRLEGTIVARTSPPRAPVAATASAELLATPTTPAAQPASAGAEQPAAAADAIAAEPTGPVLATAPRVEPLRPFVEPIRRASAIPLDPVPRGFHPAWLLVALVMAWSGVSTWLMCGPVASATWAAPLALGALLRRSTRRLRLRGGEALGWTSVALVCAQLLLLVGPAEHAWRADCLPPLGVRLPLQAGLVVLTVLFSRLGPIAVAALCWTLLTFGWCDHVDGTCNERAALARAEQRWPKDPERVAAAIAAKPLDEAEAPATRPAPRPPAPPTPATPPAVSTAIPAAGAAAPTPEPAKPAEPPREPPSPAVPMSMEQANRNPRAFLASKGARSVVLPTVPIFGEHGAEITADGTIELSRLSALLKLQGKRRILVELHTESRGDAAAEQTLTSQQAHAVRTWLESSGSIDTTRLEVVGLGSRRPLATLPAKSDLPDTDQRLELHVLDAGVH